MNKKQAHFEAFGYEPMRMKPAHLASGFFIALTDQVHLNELLNKVAVIKNSKGLLGGYAPEAVLDRLKDEERILDSMTQGDVEQLRVQVNGVVDNDDAMFGAFRPLRTKGNDYTFISPRLLTKDSRMDGYAGLFLATILGATDAGNAVLDFARTVAREPAGTLARFVNPLLADGDAHPSRILEHYQRVHGELSKPRIQAVAAQTQVQTDALKRLCENLDDYSHYRRIRYFIIGLQVWLVNYLLETAACGTAPPLLLFDFLANRDGPIRAQSQTCYARLRETVRRSYLEFAEAGRFSEDPIAAGTFARKNRSDDQDFKFLEEHFGTLALRMGYAQPRASNVPRKHFELQPDTLCALMLSVFPTDPVDTLDFAQACAALAATWSVRVGGSADDFEVLRNQGYFGFDEADLQRNSLAFAERLKELNLAIEPSDGLVLCAKDIGDDA